MSANEATRAPAVRRGAALLRELAAEPAGLSMADLARRLGAPKSSLGDLCSVLVAEGMIARTAEGDLRLGSAIPELVAGLAGGGTLLQRFEAECARFTAVDDHVVLLATIAGADSVYLAVRGNGRPQPLSLRVGLRLPAWATSTGIALLSRLSDAEIERLHATDPPALPDGRTPSPDEVLTAVDRARADGYAYDDGLGEDALSGCACLVPTESARPLAVGLIAPSGPHTRSRDVRLVKALAAHLVEQAGASGAGASTP